MTRLKPWKIYYNAYSITLERAENTEFKNQIECDVTKKGDKNWGMCMMNVIG